MLKRNFVFAAVLMTLLVVAGWAADVTGTWKGESSMGNGGDKFTLTFAFKQDGSSLTGTVQGPQGDPLPISDGKVNGDKISFTVKTDFNGGMKFSHEGTVNGDEINLTTKSEGGDQGMNMSMVLKKQK
ncbi:MAG TPA: hypothetical protein VG675_09005 [Bryobacteraceae bacterium]|nr:hypothetical protein [Bryobacteraceae bacterium]